MIKDKPIKMFIYQPLYLNGKYACSALIRFPYFRVAVGDVFTSEKRPADYHKLKAQEESCVEAVRYNLAECACIVMLEKKEFDDKKKLDRFVSGKSKISGPTSKEKPC